MPTTCSGSAGQAHPVRLTLLQKGLDNTSPGCDLSLEFLRVQQPNPMPPTMGQVTAPKQTSGGDAWAPSLGALNGTIVIGEGARRAPMLFIGEKVGSPTPAGRGRARGAAVDMRGDPSSPTFARRLRPSIAVWLRRRGGPARARSLHEKLIVPPRARCGRSGCAARTICRQRGRWREGDYLVSTVLDRPCTRSSLRTPATGAPSAYWRWRPVGGLVAGWQAPASLGEGTGERRGVLTPCDAVPQRRHLARLSQTARMKRMCRHGITDTGASIGRRSPRATPVCGTA